MMRKLSAVTTLALVLSLGAATAHAQTGRDVDPESQRGYLSVVHGIPGLDGTVAVYANEEYWFSFEYGQTFGPASMPVGAYNLQFRYQSNQAYVVLEGNAMIARGSSYTAIACLDESGAIAPLAFFENEVSPVNRPVISPSGTVASAKSRLQVFHLAAAPTIDVSVRLGSRTAPTVELSGLSNGEQATAIDFLAGDYNIGLLAEDIEVYNTGRFELPPGTNLAVFAVGVYPESFQLVYLPLN